MKFFPTLVLLAAAASMASCRPGSPSAQEEIHSTDYTAAPDGADGPQRMNVYDFTDTLSANGHTYVYTIHREASDSLPQVFDEDGVAYADNIYRLTIRRDGKPFFDKQFTKSSFAAGLSSELRGRGVLDGMMCDTSRQGLNFAVSISLPQSDFFQPFLLTIDAQAGYTIGRGSQNLE